MWTFKKHDTKALTYQTETFTHLETNLGLPKGKSWGGGINYISWR